VTPPKSHGPARLLLNLARPWGEQEPLPLARRALAAGFHGVGLADSPRLIPDSWLETERVLAQTEARLAGPVVASLGLRHPATVAGAVRTLEHHHPGRVLAVMGRGESSVHNEGVPVPSLRDYRARMETLRGLLRGDDGADRLPGRLLGAASGPRSITATAHALGGVLIDVGVDPETVGRAVGLTRTAEPEARVWLFLRALVVPEPEQAALAAAPLIGSCAMRMAAAPDWFGLDTTGLAAARAVAARHDYGRHGTANAAADLGDSDEARLVRDRFLLITSAAEMTRRVTGLAGLGIDGLVVAGGLPGVVPGLNALADALSSGLALGVEPSQPPSTKETP